MNYAASSINLTQLLLLRAKSIQVVANHHVLNASWFQYFDRLLLNILRSKIRQPIITIRNVQLKCIHESIVRFVQSSRWAFISGTRVVSVQKNLWSARQALYFLEAFFGYSMGIVWSGNSTGNRNAKSTSKSHVFVKNFGLR